VMKQKKKESRIKYNQECEQAQFKLGRVPKRELVHRGCSTLAEFKTILEISISKTFPLFPFCTRNYSSSISLLSASLNCSVAIKAKKN